MVSTEYLNKVRGKSVHVDFLDPKTGLLVWVEGVLKDDYCDPEAEEPEKTATITIETDTDCDVIAEQDIRKIYLKED